MASTAPPRGLPPRAREPDPPAVDRPRKRIERKREAHAPAPGVLGRTGDEMDAVLRPPRRPQGRLRHLPLQPCLFEVPVRAGDPGDASKCDLRIRDHVGVQSRRNGTDEDSALTDDETLPRKTEQNQTEQHCEHGTRSGRQQRRLPRLDECQTGEERPAEDERRHGLQPRTISEDFDDLAELLTMTTSFSHHRTQPSDR